MPRKPPRRSISEPVHVPRVLPRGTNSLPRDVVLLSQRSRLIEATAHAVAKKGYRETAVADIISYAGVSRTAFYQQFKDKEDCFFYCFEALNERHLESLLAAYTAPAPFKVQVHNAITEYVTLLAADGVYTLAFFAEAMLAGARVQDSWTRSKRRIVGYLREGYQTLRAQRTDLPELPPLVFELVIEALQAVLVKRIREGETSKLPELIPHLAYFVFANLGLNEWALEALQRTH